MKKKFAMTLTAGLAAIVGGIVLFQGSAKQAMAADGAATGLSFLTYTADGKIVRPEPSVYRKWVYVGTPVTPNDMNDGRPPHTPSPRHAHSQLDPAPSKAIS